jgi:hypothetical protein
MFKHIDVVYVALGTSYMHAKEIEVELKIYLNI